MPPMDADVSVGSGGKNCSGAWQNAMLPRAGCPRRSGEIHPARRDVPLQFAQRKPGLQGDGTLVALAHGQNALHAREVEHMPAVGHGGKAPVRAPCTVTGDMPRCS